LQMEDDGNWERFKIGYRNTSKSYMHASIDRHGTIQLNAFTIRKLGYPVAVALYYNRERSSIGFRPEERSDADTFPVSIRGDRGYGKIAAKSFLRFYGIKIQNTIVSDYLVIDPKGMLILDLRQARELRRKQQPTAFVADQAKNEESLPSDQFALGGAKLVCARGQES
jgi:hypothetical protein